MSLTINSYLTFQISGELFGINVAKVLEIREYMEPKAIPQSLEFVKGVIEYQQEVIPVIDTGHKFGMAPVEIQAATCMIILQLVSDVLGKTYRVVVLVDAVSDVIECEESEMKTISDDYKPAYIKATLTHEDKFIYVLNADMVFNQKEIIAMTDILKGVKK
ncbi:chemotaxis protein CheW [Natronoflexus pectinivorans]|uniref:Purine-binding chemotaxis protein CheW n=1 Tax=Natronoflexus pectinivorans TaxID=682526 RepID=A0A4R2GPD8_9BACT|nr:chemotaxis protein CheW [Natronoflexus pectinivorans]TCO10937.1 purine-binding chemotaxis protein CheW [Natronoflexus pectinivorans]